MKKKIILIFIVIALFAMTILFVSTNFESNQTVKKKVSSYTDVTLGVWGADSLLYDDSLKVSIEEKFNIKFTPLDINYSNWMNEFEKMSAFSNLPDVISHNIYGTSTYELWREEGLIREIKIDKSAYPNLYAYLENENYEQFFSSSDTLFCIPRESYEEELSWALDRAIIVRKDWRESLGIETIQSQEELEQLSSAFMQADLDGDGAINTKGIEINNMYKLDALFLSDYPELSNIERGWIQENDIWIPAYESNQMGEALDYVQSLYRKGIISEEFFFQNSEDPFHSFLEEESGILIADFPKLAMQWHAKYPDRDIEDYLEVVRPWPSHDGNTYRFTTPIYWSELYISANVSDEKLDKILSLFDYLLSDSFMNTIAEEKYKSSKSSNFFFELVSWNKDSFYDNSGLLQGHFPEETNKYFIEELSWYEEESIPYPFQWYPSIDGNVSEGNSPNIDVIFNLMSQCILSSNKASDVWEQEYKILREELQMDEVIAEANIKGE